MKFWARLRCDLPCEMRVVWRLTKERKGEGKEGDASRLLPLLTAVSVRNCQRRTWWRRRRRRKQEGKERKSEGEERAHDKLSSYKVIFSCDRSGVRLMTSL